MNKKVKITLVDDDPKFTEMFSTMLELNEYECFVNNDPKSFILLCLKEKPDLIISDVLMPGLDGLSLRKMMNEVPELKNIPFIFLSSEKDEKTILRGYDLSADDYIIKTEPPQVILKKIESKILFRDKTENNLKSECKTIEENLKLNQEIKIDGINIEQFRKAFDSKSGGDFIDYFQSSKDVHNLVLYDMMGHNLNSWLSVFPFISYIRSIVRNNCSDSAIVNTREILRKSNEAILADEGLANVFLSVSFLSINTKNMVLSYSGAGDLPIIAITGEKISAIFSEGIPLGIKQNGFYNRQLIKLKKNDSILIYTDGLIEVTDENQNQLGQSGLIKKIKKLIPDNFSLDNLISSVNNFAENGFDDDVSALKITF